MSVDGTDFLMAMSYVKSFYTYKFKKMGLRYEVGLNIKTGHICWWHGPLPPGDMNDDMIFNDALTIWLEHGERVETETWGTMTQLRRTSTARPLKSRAERG